MRVFDAPKARMRVFDAPKARMRVFDAPKARTRVFDALWGQAEIRGRPGFARAFQSGLRSEMELFQLRSV